MPKTTTGSTVELAHDTFETNARPDPFDERDLPYRPRLQLLPRSIDQRTADRRYDEFPGETDAGSSLRAAFKGWFNHGVALEGSWPNLDSPEVDSNEEATSYDWRERPLGAFYRVNPFRLDDVQSAISELTAIAVSGIIHDGWLNPVLV